MMNMVNVEYEEVKVSNLSVLVDKELWKNLDSKIQADGHGGFCTRKEAFKNAFLFTMRGYVRNYGKIKFELDEDLKSTDTGVFECTTGDRMGTPITCLVKVKSKSGTKEIVFGCNTLPFRTNMLNFYHWIKTNVERA